MNPQKTYPARYYEKGPDGKVKCLLCPHGCELKPGQTGLCLARRNIDGLLASLNYGQVTSLALDPIEKKPLKRFQPGSLILSAGSFGCNLKCSFCQNWRISQEQPPAEVFTPEQLVNTAREAVKLGNIGLAYTYNEPSIWYEFVYDCAVLAHQHGLKNVLVTNGYINKEPLVELLPYIDALNIDLKAITNNFYHEMCKGQLDYVKQTIALCAPACHVEVTTLLIPGLNDAEGEIAELAAWLASVSEDVPLHLTRHYPDYHLREPQPVSRQRLTELAELSRQSLKYVYIGNV
jgi:pyruvate formate lyase activating enzyme